MRKKISKLSMGFGGLFTAVAALLSSIGSQSSNRRRGRRGRRRWKRPRNTDRSRIHRRSASEQVPTSRPSAGTDLSGSQIGHNTEASDAERRDAITPRASRTDDQATTSTSTPEEIHFEDGENASQRSAAIVSDSVDKESNTKEPSSQPISDCRIPQDAVSASETSAPECSSDVTGPDSSRGAAQGDGSCNTRKSVKSRDLSENECPAPSSQLTDDGTKRSDNSVKPRVAGDISEFIMATSNDEIDDKPKPVVAVMSGEISQEEEDTIDNQLELDGFGCESTPDAKEMDSDEEDFDDANEKKKKTKRGEAYDRAERDGIVLEHIRRTDDGCAVVGTLIVRNDHYVKQVGARYSLNDWTTHNDSLGEWVEIIDDGEFDRFSFSVELPETGSYYMELAFFYDYHYWDNNNEQNHVVSCKMLWEDSAN